MGDERRNLEFADFIRNQFPKAETILVVADGTGELARKLANKGFRIRVIENNPRFTGRSHPMITYQKGFFTANDQVEEDLIVGMHPDEATTEIIMAAVKHSLPWAVVPCCIKGRYSERVHDFPSWVKVLKALDSCVEECLLHISGRNLVLFRKRNKKRKSR